MLTSFKRVFKFALTDFYRNKGISLAAIFILTVTAMLFTGGYFAQGISNFLISTIQNKIDITAYFKADTPEETILQVKDEIVKISPGIKSVNYVSREQALQEFILRHQGNEAFAKALTEVGENPFLPSLTIITSGNPIEYENVANVLQSEQFGNIVDKVDFTQKRDTIEKVFSITSSINIFGLVLLIILVLIATLVVFNTIRLVIDRSKDEIKTMQIVGASTWFVRAPFILEGGMFGFVAFLISFFLTIISTFVLSRGFSVILPGFDLFGYFISHMFMVMLIQLGAGIGLGVIFSFIAVRKYLH